MPPPGRGRDVQPVLGVGDEVVDKPAEEDGDQPEVLLGPVGQGHLLKLLGPAAWLLLPTALGTVARLRGAYLEAVQARAEHAERTREEEARRRVTEERMRIARDLHDVVAPLGRGAARLHP
jgi:signal transduction histidine kinase